MIDSSMLPRGYTRISDVNINDTVHLNGNGSNSSLIGHVAHFFPETETFSVLLNECPKRFVTVPFYELEFRYRNV